MNKFLFLFFTLSLLVSQGLSTPDLIGDWKEDENKRENLNDFLYEMGMSWVKRVYVTSTSWENTQNIRENNNVYTITGVKGPYAEPFDFSVTADNSTKSDISMGSLGGLMDATAEVRDGNLYTYIHDKETGETQMKVERKRIEDIDGKPAFLFSNLHVPSGVLYKATFIKQN